MRFEGHNSLIDRNLNHPSFFWKITNNANDSAHTNWDNAFGLLNTDFIPFLNKRDKLLDVVNDILFEYHFGSNHWQLSRIKKFYYTARPFLPKQLRPILRVLAGKRQQGGFRLNWPIEDRYVRFMYSLLKELQNQHPSTNPTSFWLNNASFAFVITHDVETAQGQAFVRDLAEVDERYGFQSSFNFVPEGYKVDQRLFAELRERGFEIGVHGLKHDGRLFFSKKIFEERAERSNYYLKEWQAVGFRSPFTHRNPEWMQSLEIEYDSSFFDTDPYETIPGGTMSIWPFFCGRFVELPYTLMQDHTLFETLGQCTPKLWLEKVDFIAQWGGMALVNTHPDYLRKLANLAIYEEFLKQISDRMKQAEDKGELYCWHALPREVARWWRERCARFPISDGGLGRGEFVKS